MKQAIFYLPCLASFFLEFPQTVAGAFCQHWHSLDEPSDETS
jgi:hypothetical protein